LCAAVAVFTGIILLPFYAATVEGAHRSVQAIEASTPLRFVRALHHWSSALLLLASALYLVYGVFSSSYRRPLHVAWVAAVGLGLLFFLLQLTGHLLPWDRHAVSTTVIEIAIAENAPIIGPFQARLLRGGDTVSQGTLSVWYLAHVALLPVALIALAALLLRQLRRAGYPVRPSAGVVGGALGVLLLMSVAVPAPLGVVATEEDRASFAAPPEWYTLPLHGLLNLAQSIRTDLAFVGTMVIPGLAVVWLLALPWLHRSGAGSGPSRLPRTVTVVGMLGALVLTLWNVERAAPPFRAVELPTATAAPTPSSPVRLDSAVVQEGKGLFAKHGCGGCHKVGGEGGAGGPALDQTGARHGDIQWQIAHLKAPASTTPGSTMPAYAHLSETELQALATYLVSLK
jgi:quinol-cytochrome oxidoreductase complex cytochrome b subunit